MTVPSTKQISNLLAAARRREYGPVGNVSVGSLRSLVEDFQEVPDDVDEAMYWDHQYIASWRRQAIICDSVVNYPVVNVRYWRCRVLRLHVQVHSEWISRHDNRFFR